jgi:hypothetical protein
MSEYELRRLQADGRRLVGESFMRGDTEIEPTTVEPFVKPIEHDGEADLKRLDEAVERVKSDYGEHDTGMDGALAPDVHRSLDLSRRVAADPGVWHWLTVVRYPDFVRRRWRYRSEAAMREKFLGAGSDLYSNALHRLWWIAELTHDGDDYSRTEGVFNNQTVVNKVFDRWFARYEPAVKVICDELEALQSEDVDELTRRFNHTLTNLQLEGMDRADVERVVGDIVNDLESRRRP